MEDSENEVIRCGFSIAGEMLVVRREVQRGIAALCLGGGMRWLWRSSGSYLASNANVISFVILSEAKDLLFPRTDCKAGAPSFAATSMLAIVAGIVGKGPLEPPTFVCTLLCLLVLALALFAA